MKTMMKKSSDVFPIQWLAGMCGLVILLTVPQTGLGQQTAPTVGTSASAPLPLLLPGVEQARPAPAAKSAGEDESAKPGKPGEGIKVHGHWTVEVKNPDGSLAQHVEFENSLVGGGAGDMILAQLLSGEVVIADWAIQPNYLQGVSLCSSSTTNNPCYIVATTTGAVGSVCGSINLCTPGLTLSYVPYSYNTTTSTGTPAGIQLQGGIVAAQAGSIMNVNTVVGYCTAAPVPSSNYLSTSPSQCLASTITAPPTGDFTLVSHFTGTTLGAPVAFVSGQTITFMVNISFS